MRAELRSNPVIQAIAAEKSVNWIEARVSRQTIV